ncbi:MAG: DNA repair protein RecO [Pseudomonadota bacterium]
MDWRDEGVLLTTRTHGETSVIAEVFTATHGRHVGVVRGGISRRLAPHLQSGAQLDMTWRARLEEHLGTFTVEPLKSRSAQVMGDRQALAALNAVCALLSFSLPEREAHPGLYAATIALVDILGAEDGWQRVYLQWERALLADLGFALDLDECAVTGATEDLIYVSPRTGRAVSSEGAGTYADRLLPLPPALKGAVPVDAAEIADGLRTTGHFLKSGLAASLGKDDLPAARQRFLDALSSQGRA